MTNKELIKEVQNIIKPVVDNLAEITKKVAELEKAKSISVSPVVKLELTTLVKNKFPAGHFPQQQFVEELRPLMFKYKIIEKRSPNKI